MKDKTILITGVGGLLGSRMADLIIENKPEYEVVGIDSLFGGYLENINKEVVFYKRDLAVDDISDIFNKHNIEYVYHFAAYAAEGLSPFMRKFNYSNNVISTASIINECIKHNIKRLIYTSSMSVYGWGVKFNNDKFVSIVSSEDNSVADNEYIRYERPTFAEILEVKNLVEKNFGKPASGNILYHLDKKQLENYAHNEIDQILAY